MYNRSIAGVIFILLFFGMAAYADDMTTQEQQEGAGGIRGPVTPSPRIGMDQKANVVNINTASVDELRRMPSVSDELANNIVRYRDANGPFNSVQDLRNVDGMTKSKFKRIKQYVVLEGDTTLLEPDSKTTAPKPGTSY